MKIEVVGFIAQTGIYANKVMSYVSFTGAEVQKAVMDAFNGADPKVVARTAKIVFGSK